MSRLNDGDAWQLLKNNLPPAPMYGLVVQQHFNDLVVGTYGRGFWIMDDVTPLQQMTGAVASSDVHLFEPRDAYRFHNRTSPQAPNIDMSQGTNPPYGASLNYWLGADGAGEVTVGVADGAGEVVRTLSGSTDPGINRVQWDLRYENRSQVRMRTTPLYADWVDLGADRVRTRGGGIDVMVPPGTYTVTLEVDGTERGTRSLAVLKDPNSEGTEADILAQTQMMLALSGDYDEAAEAINRIEWIPPPALRPAGRHGGTRRRGRGAAGSREPGHEADCGRGGADTVTHDGNWAGRGALSGEGDREAGAPRQWGSVGRLPAHGPAG